MPGATQVLVVADTAFEAAGVRRACPGRRPDEPGYTVEIRSPDRPDRAGKS